jgi:hypothetical protein
MRLAIALLLLAPALCGGCGRARQAVVADAPVAAPRDFGVDLTVLAPIAPAGDDAGASPDGAPAALQPHQRCGRYVVFPDGSLHSSNDQEVMARRGSDFLPGLTRRLTHAQMAQLWGLALRLGLADPARGVPPMNVSHVRPQPDQVVYLLTLTAADRRWTLVESVTPRSGPETAAATFTRAIGELAWVTDEPADRPPAPVRRYDFGPDPYARYREP